MIYCAKAILKLITCLMHLAGFFHPAQLCEMGANGFPSAWLASMIVLSV